MKLIDAPSKLVLAFAADGGKNTIPVNSSPTPGLASYQDGFPPLTRTPIMAGGIPPSGLDMNGVLFEATDGVRWFNAGGTFPFDQDFADDTNVGGYPAGALVLQSDGKGVWLNTADDQILNPNDAGASAAGWVPGVRYGVTPITMTASNVTLTPLQYSRPIIVISGTLAADVQLIFPDLQLQWVVINNTTGNYTINCKTASGSGILASGSRLLVCNGTDVLQAATDVVATSLDACAHAGGTADAITAAFPNVLPTRYLDGMPFYVRAENANTIPNPTVTFNDGVLAPKEIVKGPNLPLAIGDISGAGQWLMLQYDILLDKVVLLNPALGVVTTNQSAVVGLFNNLLITADGSNDSFLASLDQIVVESDAGLFHTVRNLLFSKDTNAWVAGNGGALDTGSAASGVWYYIFAIYNPTTDDGDFLISLSPTAPTLPSGYTYKALIGAGRTFTFSGLKFVPFYQNGKRVQYGYSGGDLPILASGALGDINTPTYSPVNIEAEIPYPISLSIEVILVDPTSGNACIAAPNSSYGAISDTTKPPLAASSAPSTNYGSFVLEANTIQYAGNGAQSILRCAGYTLR